jgi:cytoskeleton protein RodZ
MMKTIGKRLKEAREYRNLSLEKVAAETHIRLQFLQALEADDFSLMPSPVQARGFLRNYAQYLGLDLDAVIAELRKNETPPDTKDEVIFEQELPQPIESSNEDVQPADEVEAGPQEEPFWRKWVQRLSNRTVPPVEEEPAAPEAPQDRGGPRAEGVEEQPLNEEQPLSDETQALEPDKDISVQSDLDRRTLVGMQAPEEGPTLTDLGAERESSELAGEEKTGPSLWTLLAAWFHVRLNRRPAVLQEEEQILAETIDNPVVEPEPAPPAEDLPSSQEILNEIGRQLRERREMLSLSLEEIERHTRMRARYMQALESGDFDELPSTVQTRGMLNNYAGFLDLDVDAILLRFADALQVRHRERYPEKPTGRREQPAFPDTLPRLRSFIAGDLIFGLGMIILLVAFAIWGISRVVTVQSRTPEGEPGTTSPSISEALIGTPIEEVATEVSPIPVADTPLPEVPEGTLEIATPVENVAVQINIVVLERTYLRVRVDGQTVFDGRAFPGNAYPFEAEQSVDILAGNAAALRVTYNQRDLGLLGGFGELVNLVFTAEEILTPTPEPSPTATPTQPVTPSPTQIPSPTLTQAVR